MNTFPLNRVIPRYLAIIRRFRSRNPRPSYYPCLPKWLTDLILAHSQRLRQGRYTTVVITACPGYRLWRWLYDYRVAITRRRASWNAGNIDFGWVERRRRANKGCIRNRTHRSSIRDRDGQVSDITLLNEAAVPTRRTYGVSIDSRLSKPRSFPP